MCVHVEAGGQCWASPSVAFHPVCEKGLSRNLELIALSRLAGFSYLWLPIIGVTKVCNPAPGFFLWVLGVQFRFSCLRGKNFIAQVISPAQILNVLWENPGL